MVFLCLLGPFPGNFPLPNLQQAPNIVPYLFGVLGVPESSNFKVVTLWPKS